MKVHRGLPSPKVSPRTSPGVLMITRSVGMVLVAVLAIASAACGGDGDGGYSEEFRSIYMEGCLGSGTEAFCTCTLDEFEAVYSEEEFERLGLGFAESEEPPEAFIDVITACLGEIEGPGG